ncbi:MAG: DNA mismatch endonuclease Vsr [Flavobacteriales bacterium]|nr:DNA mismatch endonuclease Vsr [Flavobacteriales bacterium]
MADVHEPGVRSYNMSRIRGKDTKPEMLVRRFLHTNGFRYRLHDKHLPGKPDIILKKYNTVIFIHGCFWHGHEGCRYFVVPKTRTQWWLDKINRNKAKDTESCTQLKRHGWRIITVWECDLKKDKRDATLKRLIQKLVH